MNCENINGPSNFLFGVLLTLFIVWVISYITMHESKIERTPDMEISDIQQHMETTMENFDSITMEFLNNHESLKLADAPTATACNVGALDYIDYRHISYDAKTELINQSIRLRASVGKTQKNLDKLRASIDAMQEIIDTIDQAQFIIADNTHMNLPTPERERTSTEPEIYYE